MKSRKSGTSKSGNPGPPSDQLPKFLYDEIPSEITNESAFKSRIKGDDKNSPYAFAKQSTNKTKSKMSPKLNLKVDTSLDSLEPKISNTSQLSSSKQKENLKGSNALLNIPQNKNIGLGIDRDPSPIYDRVSQKINNILSSTDLSYPIPSSSSPNPHLYLSPSTSSTDKFQISEINSSDYGQPKEAELSFASPNTSSKSIDPKPSKAQPTTQDTSFGSFHDFSFSDGGSMALVSTPRKQDTSAGSITNVGSMTPHPYRVAASTKISSTPVSQTSQPSQYSPASVSPVPRKTSTSNTHSNSSSVSHTSTSQPSYWNMENVRQFLQDNRFNDSWVDVIVGKNLVHEAFLKLQNYEILKSYIPFLDTTGESTPSRFIQQLRKTLERQSSLNSITNQTVFSAPMIIEQNDIPSPKSGVVETLEESDDSGSLKDLESIASSNISNFKEEIEIGVLDTEDDEVISLRTIGEKLVPVVSAPTLTSSGRPETKLPAKNLESFNSLPRKKVNRPRPVSTIERSSFSTISPTVSKSFFKRHNKSTSSESTTFNSMPIYDYSSSNSSSTDLPGGYKKHSRASSKGSIKIEEAATPKSIFNKFFSKSKLGDIRGTDSPVSPSSYFTLGNSSPDLTKKESKMSKSQRRPPPDLDSMKSPASSLSSKGASSSNKVVPKFEKIGPVGKKPQPTGATIPVKTSAPSVTKTSVTPTSGQVPVQPIVVSGPPDAFSEPAPTKEVKSPGSSAIKTLDNKFKPIFKSDGSDKYILVTTNNFSFIPVNVSFIQSSVALKALLIKSLGIKLSSDVTFHLTDFGAEPGIALDDESIDLIIRTAFLNGKCMISVKQKTQEVLGLPMIGARTSSKSISESVNSETLSDKGYYPSTPQYLLNGTSLKHKESIDYMNFKEQFTPISENVTHNELRDYIAQKDFVLNSIKDNNASNNSFRVIRPEKREIDFDKRRDSPFTVSLAPQRTPPPPPLSSNSSIKSLKNSPRKLNRKPPPPSNVDDTSSLSSSGDVSVKGSIKKSGVLITRRSTIKRKASTKQKGFDPFKEYDLDSKIVHSFEGFGDYEESVDEDDDDDDSDDGLFAKAPTSNDNTVLSREATSTVSSTSSTMEVRPPPEVLYNNLEHYFPNTDLDELIIDEVVTPPVSPIKEDVGSSNQKENEQGPTLPARPRPVESSPNSLKVPVDDPKKSGKIHRMKSIRIVVQEATRKNSLKQVTKDTEPKNGAGKLLRRTSTKMWGQRVVEVKPGAAKSHYVNQLKNQNGQYKEFAWVKGELIGVGTFGKVYLALNVTTGEMIAVKQTTVSSKFINKRETTKIIDTFKAEVDSLKDLDHVNIVQYLGFEMKDNTYSIFLEYVSGGSVGSCINTYGKFPEELIKFLTEQILQGLHYIHSRGILHRDLKADNLLLEVDGNCKISDFGISKKTKDIYVNDSALSFQGTVFWMAPEVVNNTVHKGYNAKVDIWSLGCVVLQMYTGERPWQDFAIPTAILNLGKNAAPPIPKETLELMSEEGKDFLKQCFEVDPDKRPTATELLKHPFSKADPGFKFAETELAHKMKFANTLEEKRAKMISVNKGKSFKA